MAAETVDEKEALLNRRASLERIVDKAGIGTNWGPAVAKAEIEEIEIRLAELRGKSGTEGSDKR